MSFLNWLEFFAFCILLFKKEKMRLIAEFKAHFINGSIKV